MSAGLVALLAGAGFLAGAVNAVAGGGSLISFPALLAAGIPSVSANVTNTVALWPGYLGGAAGYRAEIVQLRGVIARYLIIGAVGAAVGAAVLLNTPGHAFEVAVPYLVLLGTVLFAFQPIVTKLVRSGGDGLPESLLDEPAAARSRTAGCGVTLASVYGAYFGAGLGVMLLAVLGLGVGGTLQELNAVKNTLSLVVNTIALVAFAFFGPVRWTAVIIMAVASLTGGYLGSLVARRLPAALLRGAVISLGAAISVALFVKN